MSISDVFKEFLSGIAVDNAESISLRYGELTGAINKNFRDTESKTTNNLQVGSYGRWTAIKGISDLDMLYIMPDGLWDTYKSGGQYSLLKETADAIKRRYPRTEVFVDRLVVRVLYADFHVEVQPVFETEDGSFLYPDTYGGGAWKNTNPRAEISAMSEFDEQKNKNLRRLCKMARAWKNKHGVGMGGLLIDTLAHNFLRSTAAYDDKSFLYYDLMSRDFFKYLADLPSQEYFAALGSGQRVRVKKSFRKKAARAYDLCLAAIAAEKEVGRNDKWRKVFGSPFPHSARSIREAIAKDASNQARNTEEFVEDKFPVDVRYDVTLECEVSQSGFRPHLLRQFLAKHIPLSPNKSLRFIVDTHDIPKPFDLYWKVLNRGPEAIRRDCVRGQVEKDQGSLSKTETTSFRGDHVVECYVVRNGTVVAKDRIHVPIQT
ncbi:MAG: nucleotidyltransferase [Myxococcaceae bacterium]|nr:nucleotidyltransferase [Myxococcaceae bacterium]